MSPVQWTVRMAGWLFILVGVLGFNASGTSLNADPVTAPRLFGVFPVNAIHNGVHLAFGVWAMIAYHSRRWATSYATITGTLYLVLAVLGFLAPHFFGLMPIGGADVALHAGLGLVLAGVGFAAPGPSAAAEPPPSRPSPPSHVVDEPPRQPDTPPRDRREGET